MQKLIYNPATKVWSWRWVETNGLVYEVSRGDRMSFDEGIRIAQIAREISNINGAGKAQISDEFPLFVDEVFHRVYSTVERPLSIDEIRPEHGWAVVLHQQLSDSPDWPEMRRAIGSEYLSTLATRTFVKTLLQEINKLPGNLPGPGTGGVDPARVQQLREEVMNLKSLAQQIVQFSLENQLKDAGATPQQAQQGAQQASQDYQKNMQNAVDQLQQQLDQLQQQGQNQDGATAQDMMQNALNEVQNRGIQDQLNKAIERGKRAVEAAQKLAEFLRNRSPEVRKAAEEAAKQVKEEIEVVEGLLWGDERGEYCYVHPEILEAYVKLLANPSTRSFLRQTLVIAGRLKPIAASVVAVKHKEAKNKFKGVEQGNNISLVLPSELVKAKTNPAQFVRDWRDRNLQQSKQTGTKKVGRGPLVVCIDRSGSTEGDILLWEKAVAMATLEVAMEQGRAFRLIHFDSDVAQTDDFPKIKSWEDGKRMEARVRLLSAVLLGAAGGTSYQAPLDSAVAAIEKTPQLKDADILFITDGACDVESIWLERFLAKKKRLSFRVTSCLIGAQSESLLKFSDTVMDFAKRELYNNSPNPEKLRKLFTV